MSVWKGLAVDWDIKGLCLYLGGADSPTTELITVEW
jgi:hypothetical protein